MTTAADASNCQGHEVSSGTCGSPDTRGKEQHVSVPAHQFNMSKFETESSTAPRSRWKGIQASDMCSCRPASVRMDPFTDEPTLIVSATSSTFGRQGYDRPALDRQARRGLPEVHRLGDTATSDRAEFFVFDSVTWSVTCRAARCEIVSEEAPWSAGEQLEAAIRAPAPDQGGLLSRFRGPIRCRHSSAMCWRSKSRASRWKCTTRRWRQPPVRDRYQVRAAGPARRLDADPEVPPCTTLRFVRQDRTFMPSRWSVTTARACTPPVRVEGRQEPVRRQRLCRAVPSSRCITSRHHKQRAR